MSDMDYHHLIFFPERVDTWLKGHRPMPITMEMGLTTACNYRCSYCALDWVRGDHTMQYDVAKKALKDAAGMGVCSVHFAGEGEPMLFPLFCKLVGSAKNELGLAVGVTTNGSVLNSLSDDHLWRLASDTAWIRISMDAGTREEYASIHGRDGLDMVTRGVERLLSASRSMGGCKVSLQAVSIGQGLIPLIELGRKLGVDHVVIKPYSHHPKSKSAVQPGLIPLSSADGFLVGRKRAEEGVSEGHDYMWCWAGEFFILVAANGDVIPCNLFYGDSSAVFGNVNTQPLHAIWSNRQKTAVCGGCRRGCRLHEANKYLEILHRGPEGEELFL